MIVIHNTRDHDRFRLLVLLDGSTRSNEEAPASHYGPGLTEIAIEEPPEGVGRYGSGRHPRDYAPEQWAGLVREVSTMCRETSTPYEHVRGDREIRQGTLCPGFDAADLRDALYQEHA